MTLQKWLFKSDLKDTTEFTALIFSGRSFQNLEAPTAKVLSPLCVNLDLETAKNDVSEDLRERERDIG